LGSGQTIDSDNFNLKLPKTKEFILTAKDFGSGQKIYSFDLECTSEKTFLCATKGVTEKRTLLLTMNYEPTDEEKAIKQNLSENLGFYIGELNYFYKNLNEFENITDKLNNTLEIEPLKMNIDKTQDLISESNTTSTRMINLWNIGDYYSLNNEFPSFKDGLMKAEDSFYEINDSINYNIVSYNSLIDILFEVRYNLENLEKLNLTDNSSEKLNDMVEEFNNLTLSFNEKDLISNKKIYFDNLLNQTQSFSPEFSNETHLTSKLNNLTFEKIKLNPINFSSFNLSEPYEKCCYNNICEKCGDTSSENENKNYPIIFIHGHSFNQAVSAEESLDTFEEIQRALESDNYIDAGSLYLSSSKGNTTAIWGKINYPLTIKASYYFDLLTNNGEDVLIQTKTDNLDTYTLRLKEIIDEVKSKTGKQKVILIAHSMGGLIVRRYVEVFGEGDIDKLILISVPNHGITGKSLTLCSVFGTKLECNDMDKDSLFLNKLNNAKAPNIPIYNIIGTGCITNRETGDGVVTNSSQYLNYASNYYVDGSCKESEFTYLHTEILKPEKYPETLGFIREFLNIKNP